MKLSHDSTYIQVHVAFIPKLCSVYKASSRGVEQIEYINLLQSMSPHFGTNSMVKLSVSNKTPNKTQINIHPRICTFIHTVMTVCTKEPEDEAGVCKVMHKLNCTGIIGDLEWIVCHFLVTDGITYCHATIKRISLRGFLTWRTVKIWSLHWRFSGACPQGPSHVAHVAPSIGPERASVEGPSVHEWEISIS